ncbi:MAG: hypothetical protein M0017_01805, partial [Desulfobacteraceae bacterium]|nr:hypothetical protein [Desulfobacteraceae bacterium]
MRAHFLGGGFLLLILLIAGTARADPPPDHSQPSGGHSEEKGARQATEPSKVPVKENIVTTTHSAIIGGTRIDYT